ncbi:MAG: type II methionyl aminopeptidase [Candidatus Micrarchaeota archaeon]|nr:type II methionyl aminopeptidase [Candidatus Micrarchaeota archaeon]
MTKVSAEEIDTIKEVGRISSEAILYAADLVRPGAKLLEVAESAEKFLRDKGYGLAFPINLSVNEQAAHYTPSMSDESVFTNDDLVKIDFGGEKNGMLGDGAITVDLSGKYAKMVEAADKSLDKAIGMIRHGVSVCDIGKAIADSAESDGFRPIKNLGGHGIGLHDLHAELFIPNYDNGDFTVVEEGMVIAIEPFLTTGDGLVVDGDFCEIYSYDADSGSRQVRSSEARALLQHIEKNNSKEPFAVRWFSNLVGSRFRLYAAVSELVRSGAIEPSPVLVEASGGMVAQAEAQVIVTKDGFEVITRAKR